jgi:tetratricopeptide (TPR) repeat protein
VKPESIALGVAGVCFGVIVGWVLGSQQAARTPPVRLAQAQTAPPDESGAGAGSPRAAVLDQSQVQALRNVIDGDAKNVNARVQLANLYFDAEKYDDAIKWYEEALKLSPRDANVSTDLGVSYYYLNQPDRALKQFEYSLSVDPKHTKTILNQGIVRAFGKQDLEGAAQSWQKVLEMAPASPEAQAARRALDSMKSAHPGLGGQSK